MSSVGILAWKSALEDGNTFEVPDFKNEAVRKKYENDNWSSFPNFAGPGQPSASILGDMEIPEEDLEYAKKIWKEIGYEVIR